MNKLYKNLIIALIPVLFLKLPVFAFDVTQLGDYESRSIYYSTQTKPINQEQKDLLASKKLANNIYCLVKQIEKNEIENVKLLLNSGININASYIGDTPLYIAVKKNNYEITKLLLEHNAKPDNGFYSELYLAIKNKNEKIAQLLIEKKANVNYTDLISGNTPLYMSLKNNMLPISAQLIQRGAFIDSKAKILIQNKKLENLINN